MKPSHVFACVVAAAAALVGFILYRRGKSTSAAGAVAAYQTGAPVPALPPAPAGLTTQQQIVAGVTLATGLWGLFNGGSDESGGSDLLAAY